MIDTKELRRLAQAATLHVGHACKYQDAHWLREGHVDFDNADLFIASERPQEDAAFYAAANPATVIELLDRLEAAESDALEQARLNGMGSEREAALVAKLEVAEKERGIDEQRIADLMDELNRVGHENDALRSKNHQYEVRLRKILEEPENTMSNSKVLAEVIRQARLALGVKK